MKSSKTMTAGIWIVSAWVILTSKKQIARILSQNKLTADYVSWFPHNNGIEAYTDNVEFKKIEENYDTD